MAFALVQSLPPQAEEQGAIRHLGHELLDAVLQRLRGLILRIRRKSETRERIQFIGDARHLFGGFDNVQELAYGHVSTQFAAYSFEGGHLFINLVEGIFQFGTVHAPMGRGK